MDEGQQRSENNEEEVVVGGVSDPPFIFKSLLSDEFGKVECKKLFSCVIEKYRILSLFPKVGNNTPMCYMKLILSFAVVSLCFNNEMKSSFTIESLARYKKTGCTDVYTSIVNELCANTFVGSRSNPLSYYLKRNNLYSQFPTFKKAHKERMEDPEQQSLYLPMHNIMLQLGIVPE